MTTPLEGAVFSPCREYRYTLSRLTGVYRKGVTPGLSFAPPPTCLFIGLNPSTADEEKNDPTVTRMLGFARAWGYERLVVCNIFAYRSTDPLNLYEQHEPVGPENDVAIHMEALAAAFIVCAWGNHGDLLQRGDKVRHDLRLLHTLHALGHNAGGQPKHPLYLRADTTPVVWERGPISETLWSPDREPGEVKLWEPDASSGGTA